MTLQVAKSLSNLASLLNDVERYEEAEKAYRASLSIREDALGETNVQVRHWNVSSTVAEAPQWHLPHKLGHMRRQKC